MRSDNPHQDQAFIKKGLGDRVKALKDVFHVIQDIAKLVKMKHGLHAQFMADLSACFFEAFAEDMERHRQKLIDEGIPVSTIRKMLGNMRYVKSQTSIRRGIRKGDEIVDLLNKLWLKYADKDIFVKGAFDELPKCFKTSRVS